MKPDSVKAGYTFTDPNMIGEVDEYFYHGDHISSVVLVTDKKAKVVQQFAYMPFGELLVDNSTVDLDYRFSAKETDRESGLGYFGARYYDNTSAMWLGVDPLWEKYAGMNPYNYCAGNPVIYIDPDGKKWVKREVEGIIEIYYDRKVTSQKDLDHRISKGKGGGYSYVKDKYNSTMLNDGDSYDGYVFYNDSKENKNGKVYKNGQQIQGKAPMRGLTSSKQRYDIFVGTSDDCVDAKTLHNNFFGTSYTGPNNPQSYNNKWNYDYCPYNVDEYGSVAHDLAYDNAHVEGVSGALFSTSVKDADWNLVIYNLKCADNALTGNPQIWTATKCTMTAGAFTIISGIKSVINIFK